MDDTERRSAKRSRFDQTEPEPKRASRFDRRSRSPPSRKSDSGRDRSPLPRDVGSSGDVSKKPAVDPAAAAGMITAVPKSSSETSVTNTSVAAAAAKINAQLQARKGIQHVDVPPVRSAASTTSQPSGSDPAAAINGEMYIADGDYIKDIEVNDLRNRYTLTKGSTQKMVNLPLATSS